MRRVGLTPKTTQPTTSQRKSNTMCCSLPDPKNEECPHCGGPIDSHDGTCLKGADCQTHYRQQIPFEPSSVHPNFWVEKTPFFSHEVCAQSEQPIADSLIPSNRGFGSPNPLSGVAITVI